MIFELMAFVEHGKCIELHFLNHCPKPALSSDSQVAQVNSTDGREGCKSALNHPERMEDIERIGNVTRAGVAALTLGNLQAVGIAMNECHRLLQGIGVSDDDLDQMVEAALPSSLGAKLTGAGGGGCMIALTMEPRRTAEAIELVGGRTMVSQLGAPGVRIEND